MQIYIFIRSHHSKFQYWTFIMCSDKGFGLSEIFCTGRKTIFIALLFPPSSLQQSLKKERKRNKPFYALRLQMRRIMVNHISQGSPGRGLESPSSTRAGSLLGRSLAGLAGAELWDPREGLSIPRAGPSSWGMESTWQDSAPELPGTGSLCVGWVKSGQVSDGDRGWTPRT